MHVDTITRGLNTRIRGFFGPWFILVQNVMAKYSIMLDNIHNFDKVGFMMGIIFVGMVITTSDGRSKVKLA
jgi:hypothetical protein